MCIMFYLSCISVEPFNVPVNNIGGGGGETHADPVEDGHTQDQEQESSHGELGSASFAGSQSEEETSDEEDDDDDDGEIKDDFTYQSDASYSQGSVFRIQTKCGGFNVVFSCRDRDTGNGSDVIRIL